MQKLILFSSPLTSVASNGKHTIQLFLLFLFLWCISGNAVAQSGTVTFTGASNVNMGLVLHDGTNSNDIAGIQLDIFGAMTPAAAAARTSSGSFVFLSTDVIGTDYGIFDPIDATNGGYIEEPNNLPRLVVIMSHDGSAFNFKSIYVGDYIDSNTPIKFEGFRDGVSTGAVSLVLGAANNYQKTFDSSNGLTASIFQNVDEVRITNQIEGDMTHGIYAGFNNITIAPAVQPTTAPTVTTQAVSSITATTATGNGTITVTGGANSTERGIYYSTTNGFANGTGTKVSTTGNWSTTGAFTQNITGLTAGTTYYAKAFATNSAGTNYGTQVSFTTTVACLTTPVEGLTTFNSVPSSYTEYARSTNASSGISALSVACSGWDVTGYTTAGSDPYIIASENWTPASDGGFIYLALESGTQTISSLRFKSNDGKLFDLNAMDLGYDANSNIKFIITGYKNGTAVSGATYNVAAFNHFGSGGNWKTGINIASNTNFIGIDEFRITADVPNQVWAIDVDNINATNFRTPPPTTAPNAPTIGTVTAGNGQASVTFTPPASNGGSAITGYTVTSSPGGSTATGASSPIIVTGLTNGTAYTFTVTATNAIGTSSASAASSSVTPATVPNAPTIGTVTAGNGQASVTFTAPASNGGSAITGYTVTSSPGGSTATGASSPIIVTGLSNGTAYTFTVTATNAIGTSSTSAASSNVTPATVPNAPTIGIVTAGNGQASVAFTAPASNGGSAITSYTVTSNPSGSTATGASSPIIVTGLTNGTAYTFTVTATNAIGTSSASDSGTTTPTLSTASNTMQLEGVSVYPNPVTDGFYVTVGENFSSYKTYTCILTDMMGKTVMQETIKSGAYIAAENLPTGVYVLLVQNSDKSAKIKIVKK